MPGTPIKNEIAISMDGKGARRDNVFVERFWRSIKYEEVYLRAYEDVPEARKSIGRYLGLLQRPTGHTRRLIDAPPIRPTSTRCHSAR
jgi:putative transposase